MAIVITSQVLYDGPRRATLQFTGSSDGAGQLDFDTLVDASALSALGPGQLCGAVKVEKINATVSYGVIELYWGALIPVRFAVLSGDNQVFCYEDITALNNAAAGPSATGDILISTIGFSANSTFMLKLELIKKKAS